MPHELAQYLDLARRVEALAVAETPDGTLTPEIDGAVECFVAAAQHLRMAVPQSESPDGR